MLLVLGTFRVSPAKLEQAKPAMQRMTAASRAEDGCIDYAYAADLFDPGLMHVRELWRDLPALERHVASEHMADWRKEWPGLEIGDARLQRYHVSGQSGP